MRLIFYFRYTFSSLSYRSLNYLEDPHHNDFNEMEGDSEQLIQLRKELIDLVSKWIFIIFYAHCFIQGSKSARTK